MSKHEAMLKGILTCYRVRDISTGASFTHGNSAQDDGNPYI